MPSINPRYLAEARLQPQQQRRLQASLLPDLGGYAAITGAQTIRAPQLNTYAINPAIDRVPRMGNEIVANAAENLAITIGQVADDIAKKKSILDADEARAGVFKQTQQILYEGDGALFKKEGKAYIDAVGPVRKQIEDTLVKAAENLSPDARFRYLQYANQEKEVLLGQMAREELKALNSAQATRAERIIGDGVLQLSTAKPADFPGIIDSITNSIVATLDIEDPDAQVTMGRKYQQQAYAAGVKHFLGSGRNLPERLANVDKAEELLQVMRTAPGVDLAEVDTLFSDTYTKRTDLYRRDQLERQRLDLTITQQQTKLGKGYQDSILEANLNGSDAKGRTVAEITANLVSDPALLGTKKQQVLDTIESVKNADLVTNGIASRFMVAAANSGGFYADVEEFNDLAVLVEGSTYASTGANLANNSRKAWVKQYVTRAVDDLYRAVGMLQGQDPINLREYNEGPTDTLIGPHLNRIVETMTKLASQKTPEGKYLDMSNGYEVALFAELQQLQSPTNLIKPVYTKYKPQRYDVFLSEIGSGQHTDQAVIDKKWKRMSKKPKGLSDAETEKWAAATQAFAAQVNLKSKQFFGELPTHEDMLKAFSGGMNAER